MQALATSKEKGQLANLDLFEACGSLEELQRWYKEYKKIQTNVDEQKRKLHVTLMHKDTYLREKAHEV